MKRNRVPVLVTWDVDPDHWASYDQKQRALSMALDLCEEFDIQSTFFITAEFFDQEYPRALQRIKALGHEVGCHGLTHTDEEEYHRMPIETQQTYIGQATRRLETVIGKPVRVFRSPRVKTSATTLRLLAEHGYLADSSVCSQRLDFFSSNLINPGWLIAPRRPYHPHSTNAFKRGDLPIWEVPISALGMPFISGALNVLGVRFMKILFRLLYVESRVTGKPIVYLAHPPEFIRLERRKLHITLEEFSPSYIRTHGFRLRRSLGRMNGETLFNATRELFAYIFSFPGITPMTSSEYIHYLENHTGTDNDFSDPTP